MSESILEKAQRLIHGDRNVSYGHPRDNFAAIAAIWNGYLDAMGPRTRFSPQDVANMMIAMKLARVVNDNYHEDSYTDICGYAGTAERLQEPLPGLVLPHDPSYHYVLHTEPTGGSYTVGGQTFTHDGRRIVEQITELTLADGITKLVDNEGYTWEKRGRFWGWIGSSEEKIWHKTLKADLKDREDGPFTEVK